jgi:predicted transcriptional regulator
VSKLKELGKHVIGLGMQESTSDLLRDNCDEFIYYEDLGKAPDLAPEVNPQLPETKRKAFALLLESLLALRRENKEVLWSSMIKDTMKRKKPSFNESYHGYRTFSELLEDAQKEGLVELDTDKRSRTYVVTRFGSEMAQAAAAPAPAKKKSSRRRRSSAKKRPANGAAPAPSAAEPAPRDEAPAPEPFDDGPEPAREPPEPDSTPPPAPEPAADADPPAD